MFIEGMIIGFLLGKIRGGRILNLEKLSINGWPLAVVALLVQILPIFFNEMPFVSNYGSHIQLFSSVLLGFVLFINLDKAGIWLLLLGVLMNGLVPFLNILAIGDGWEWIKYSGKFISLPEAYPLVKNLSVGDLFITGGLIYWIQDEMIKNRFHLKNKMIKFKYKGKI